MTPHKCEGCKHYSVTLDLHERTELPVGAKNSCALNLNPDVDVICNLYERYGVQSHWYTYTGKKYSTVYPEPEKPWNKDMPWYKKVK